MCLFPLSICFYSSHRLRQKILRACSLTLSFSGVLLHSLVFLLASVFFFIFYHHHFFIDGCAFSSLFIFFLSISYYINYLTKAMQLEDPRIRYRQLQNEHASTESIPLQTSSQVTISVYIYIQDKTSYFFL